MKEKSIMNPTATLTFRATASMVEKLKLEANQKDITINTLLNQILKQHLDWHCIAHKAGFLTVRVMLITRLLDEVEEEERIKLIASDVAKSSNKDLLLLIEDKYDVYAALEFVESWLKTAGFQYKHDISPLNPNLHRFIIYHNMGRKWSVYLSELYRNLFREFPGTDIHSDLTANTLQFTVDIGRQ